MAFDWLGLAATVGGGLLGANASKKGTSETAEKKMDPRMDRYVYGADGQSGLMGSGFELMQKQLATGGLNDMQRQGMDMQRQYLMSPQYQQGYGNMGSLGQSLMGAGVAGNPFTGGATSKPSGSGFQYSGAQNAAMPDYKMQPAMLSPANQQAAQKATNGLLGSRETGGGGGGRSGSYGGTDYGNDSGNEVGYTAGLMDSNLASLLGSAVFGPGGSFIGEGLNAAIGRAMPGLSADQVEGLARSMAQMDAQAAENDAINAASSLSAERGRLSSSGVSSTTGGGGNNNRSDGRGNNGYGGGRGFGSGTNQQ